MTSPLRRPLSRPLSGRKSPEEKLLAQLMQKSFTSDKVVYEKGFLGGQPNRPSSATTVRPKSARPKSARQITTKQVSEKIAPNDDPSREFYDTSRKYTSQSSVSSTADVFSKTFENEKRPVMNYMENKDAEDGTSRLYLLADKSRPITPQEMHLRKYGPGHRIAFGKTTQSDEETARQGLQNLFPSLKQADRKKVIHLRETFHEALRTAKDQSLYKEQTKLVYMSCFNEIFRQVSITCQERGQLLYELWHGIISTYEYTIEALKTSPIIIQSKGSISKENETADIQGYSREEIQIQNARLSEINDMLRAQLVQSNEYLSAKDADAAEAIKKVAAQYELRIQKMAVESSTYQGFLRKLDDIIDTVRDEFPEAAFKKGTTKGFESYSVEINLEIVSLLIKKEKDRIIQSEHIVAKMQSDQDKLSAKIKELEGILHDERDQRERVNRQLRKEREVVEELSEKLSSIEKETKEVGCFVAGEETDDKFTLPVAWRGILSGIESDMPLYSPEDTFELVKDILSSTLKTNSEGGIYEISRAQLQLRFPMAPFDEIDKYMMRFLQSVHKYRWEHDTITLFSRLTNILHPYKKRAIYERYAIAMNWVKSHPKAIALLTSQRVPCITILGQSEFLDEIHPNYSAIRKIMFMYNVGYLGVSTTDIFWNKRRSCNHGTYSEFPQISFDMSHNAKFYESVDVNRFILYYLDEYDEALADSDKFIHHLFQAANFTNETHITYQQFHSIVKFVNGGLDDTKISSIFCDGNHETIHIDELTFVSLEKKYKFITPLPPLPVGYKGEKYSKEVIMSAWARLKPQIVAEIEDIRDNCSLGRLPDRDHELVSGKYNHFSKMSETPTDTHLLWLTFLNLLNDLVGVHQRLVTVSATATDP